MGIGRSGAREAAGQPGRSGRRGRARTGPGGPAPGRRAPAHRKVSPLDALARLFQALADPTRLRILALLGAGEVCVCDIHDSLGIPQPRTSRHLAYLRRHGLVEARKRGLWVYYRRAAPRDPVARTLLSAVEHGLTHVDRVGRDLDRLVRRTGCCRPAGRAAPELVCCAGDALPPDTPPAAVAVPVGRT